MKFLSISKVGFALVVLLSSMMSFAVNNNREHSTQLIAPDAANIIPEQFLRRWDPVTLFFKNDIGKRAGTEERQPEKWVKMTPSHPGVYTWLNESTLQFKPIEPWQALAQVNWEFDDQLVVLESLMREPSYVFPYNGSTNIEKIEQIELKFSEFIEISELEKMIRIELIKLPGLDSDNSIWLDHRDFTIKKIQSNNKNDPHQYIVKLNDVIGSGYQATLQLQLGASENLDHTFVNYVFQTQLDFQLVLAGCGYTQYPFNAQSIQYSKEQAIECENGYDNQKSSLSFEFSAALDSLSIVDAKNLIRLRPMVDGFEISQSNNTLYIYGNFKTEQLYEIEINPSDIKSHSNQSLQLENSNRFFVHFPKKSSFLSWKKGDGIMESFGPKMLPMSGRGFDKVDLRIYPIDALDYNLWPFSDRPIVVDEQTRPAGPGEESINNGVNSSAISEYELKKKIKELGSPVISEIVQLPIEKGSEASFGLDISNQLARIYGADQPGTYLVGIRTLDDTTSRSWVRIQVTDLSLSVFEEKDQIKFLVTSLQDAKPVANAQINIDGRSRTANSNNASAYRRTLKTLTTDENGMASLHYFDLKERDSIERIVVNFGQDTLVLNPDRAPSKFKDGIWRTQNSWLDWLSYYKPKDENSGRYVCHLFTERPVYKPEDKVYLNGYIRWYDSKKASFKAIHPKSILKVEGPGSQEWVFQISENNKDDLQQIFEDEKSPTGTYYAYYYVENQRCGSVSFKKEAYKVPKFEVNLHGDELIALDKPFDVEAIAEYYAGGQLSEQEITWRVTQVPFNWVPNTTEFKDFAFSSDSRFSGRSAFRSSSNIYETAKTDRTGSAKLSIDPTIEIGLNPRSYVVEATVTDIDLQQVTNTKSFNGVPPLVLGLNVDRYFEKTGDYFAQLIALDFDGNLIAGQDMNVRLIKRVWQSHLQATDFANGEAKYKTQVSESIIFEDNIVSEADVIKLPISLNQSGVYVLQIQTQDKLGRMQEIAMDFFVDGTEAVTWSKPPSDVFTVTSDKKQYEPGDTATLILESPFQNAMAMAVVETPTGFEYQLIEIKNGSASFDLKIEQRYMPKLPVHFLLWRGRLGNFNIQARLDLGKPTTVASTKWLNVSPVANQIKVELKHADKKQPGEELEIEISLQDYKNNSISGRVTLWLVDQAVLSLGNEQKLNILDDFIVYRDSRLSITDTRNLGFGYVPFDSKVGGGLMMSKMEQMDLIDNVTVRKNFQDVPFYDVIKVDDSGKATVKVTLPDNLTKFKIRAKVESADELFGYAKSQVEVQLPVLVQPALPRFLRLGDSFVAQAIARVIDNTSGDAIADLKVTNVLIKHNDEALTQQTKNFALNAQSPVALKFDVKVPLEMNLEKIDTADIQVAVVRLKDETSDAFKVSLPILTDQNLVKDSKRFVVKAGETITIDGLNVDLRENTFNAKMVITNDERFLSLRSALSYLIEYPHGCTEQRISKAQSILTYEQFDWLATSESSDKNDEIINQTLDWIKATKGDNGHIGFWPGSDGYVFLSAIAVRFIHQAQQAGYYVDEAFKRQLVDMLKRSLRKDYSGFIVGEQYTERAMALLALNKIGELDDSYVAELMRNAQFLNTHSRALLLQVLSEKQASLDPTIEQSLWDDMVFKLYQNNEIWTGFQSNSVSSKLILPSDTQTLAASLQALVKVDPEHPRIKLLLNGLFELSDENGWGTTRANASALDSLFEWINQAQIDDNEFSVALTEAGNVFNVNINKMEVIDIEKNNEMIVTNPNDFDVTINLIRKYMPKESGAKASNINNGFVIERNWVNVSKANLKMPINSNNQILNINLGDVIEEHVQVINQSSKVQVAIKIPIAAGVEPLNPELNISNSDAITTGQLTLKPSYTQYLDDSVTFYYDQLPKGNLDFYFRVRATTQGEFTQPPANIQMMYDDKVWAQSFGAKVIIHAVDTQ